MDFKPPTSNYSFSLNSYIKGSPTHTIDTTKSIYNTKNQKIVTITKLKYTYKKNKINITGVIKKNKKSRRINIKNITEDEILPSITKIMSSL